MAGRLSVVIPTLQAAAELPATLAALEEGRHGGLIGEVLVSDGGSSDGTAAAAAAARVVTGPPGRGAQIARGINATDGDWLLILHADTHLAPGWAEAVRRHIDRHPKEAAYFRLRFRATGLAPMLVARWANLRSRLFGLPYGDQGLLIARGLLDEIGGYPALPLMEDVALARRLAGKLRRLPVEARSSAARYEARGWLRQGGANLWRLACYATGSDAAVLARRYRGG